MFAELHCTFVSLISISGRGAGRTTASCQGTRFRSLVTVIQITDAILQLLLYHRTVKRLRKGEERGGIKVNVLMGSAPMEEHPTHVPVSPLNIGAERRTPGALSQAIAMAYSQKPDV